VHGMPAGLLEMGARVPDHFDTTAARRSSAARSRPRQPRPGGEGCRRVKKSSRRLRNGAGGGRRVRARWRSPVAASQSTAPALGVVDDADRGRSHWAAMNTRPRIACRACRRIGGSRPLPGWRRRGGSGSPRFRSSRCRRGSTSVGTRPVGLMRSSASKSGPGSPRGGAHRLPARAGKPERGLDRGGAGSLRCRRGCTWQASGVRSQKRCGTRAGTRWLVRAPSSFSRCRVPRRSVVELEQEPRALGARDFCQLRPVSAPSSAHSRLSEAPGQCARTRRQASIAPSLRSAATLVMPARRACAPTPRRGWAGPRDALCRVARVRRCGKRGRRS